MIAADPSRYLAVCPNDRATVTRLLRLVPADEDLMAEIARLHAEGSRCAAVVRYPSSGDLAAIYAANADVIRARFPLEEVRRALEEYDPATGVCIIWQRDHHVTALVTGRPSDKP